MLLIHDIVEIDAGDTPLFDDTTPDEQLEIEQVAAARLFGLLPDDQAAILRSLWEEFEAAETPDAKKHRVPGLLEWWRGQNLNLDLWVVRSMR